MGNNASVARQWTQDEIWDLLDNMQGQSAITLRDRSDRIVWVIRKYGGRFSVVNADSSMYCTLSLRESYKHNFSLHGILNGDLGEILFQFSEGGLTAEGREHFGCRELARVYIGPPGALKFRYDLRLI